MEMKTLKEVLMERDEMTSSEADEHINECKKMILSGMDPEDVLYDECGLELDYIFDLL